MRYAQHFHGLADSTFADLNYISVLSIKEGATASLKSCQFVGNTLPVGRAGAAEKSGTISVEAGFAHSTGVRVEKCEFEDITSGFRFIKKVGNEALEGGYTGQFIWPGLGYPYSEPSCPAQLCCPTAMKNCVF